MVKINLGYSKVIVTSFPVMNGKIGFVHQWTLPTIGNLSLFFKKTDTNDLVLTACRYSSVLVILKAATGGVLWKTVFLKISQVLQENICVGVSLSQSYKPSGLQLYLKETSTPGVFKKFSRTLILKNICEGLHFYNSWG